MDSWNYIYIERDKVDQDTHVDTFRYMYIPICMLYIYIYIYDKIQMKYTAGGR